MNAEGTSLRLMPPSRLKSCLPVNITWVSKALGLLPASSPAYRVCTQGSEHAGGASVVGNPELALSVEPDFLTE